MAEEEDDDFPVYPPCSYITYKSEGDWLYRLGKYEKAIESYTQALQQEPKNRNCLVARSRCFLLMGNTAAALCDAEASQMENEDFPAGLYQKAESLYAKGEFELALMHYHRGQKLRPRDRLFRLGIQKAQEAITNSVGSPSSVRLDMKCDLSFFYRKEEKVALKTKQQLQRQSFDQKQALPMQSDQLEPKTNRTERALLGEFYHDKEYLKELLLDNELMNVNAGHGRTVKDLIADGLTFLDAQTEFWREQKPIFARERERRLREQIYRSRRLPTQETILILQKLAEINALFAEGHIEECKQAASELLQKLKGWTTREVPGKVEFLADLYNAIGSAQAELGDMEGALESLNKDLHISRKHDNTEGISRALDVLGRVYVRIGEFKKAAEVWLEKEPLAKSSLERTWLFHEIGRCFLELKDHVGARDYGLKSLASAKKAGAKEWKMNANVLVAQAEFKLGNLHKAMEFFEKALEKASLLNDDAAQVAISNALQNVQEKIKLVDKAEEEELEQCDTKQSSSISEGSSSTDSVCGLYSSESLPISDWSTGDSFTSTSSDSVCLLPSLSSELRLERKGQLSDDEGSALEGAEAGSVKGEAAEEDGQTAAAGEEGGGAHEE